MVHLIYLPLLLLHLNQTRVYTYCWERYGLEFQSSLVLNEMSDSEYWEVDDDELDFWFDAERIAFSDVEPEILKYDLAKATQFMADTLGYENVKRGGSIPNIPESHYVVCKEDDTKSYIILAFDRPKQVIYQIIIEDFLDNKKNVTEVMNSLRIKP